MSKTANAAAAMICKPTLRLLAGILAIAPFLALGYIEGASPALALPGNSRLTVEIRGLRNQEGDLCLRVYDRAEGFPDGEGGTVREQCSPIGELPFSVEFDELAFGTYAIALFHDENGDRDLNTSLGVPREGFGFSNNPALRSGPPEFSETVFLFGGSDTTIEIDILYLF